MIHRLSGLVDSPLRAAWFLTALGAVAAALWWTVAPTPASHRQPPLSAVAAELSPEALAGLYPQRPRMPINDSGFIAAMGAIPDWPATSLTEIRDAFDKAGYDIVAQRDRLLEQTDLPLAERIGGILDRGLAYLYEGDAPRAYDDFTEGRELLKADPALSAQVLSTFIFMQGIAGLRRGETENCLHCLGEGACVFPLVDSAVHKQVEGSRLAVEHFQEYLQRHPEDVGVQWLLNVAAMTLGEYPHGIPPEHLLRLDQLGDEPEHAIGSFRDLAYLAGVNRTSQAGGAIMDDFDNDGRLDIVVSSVDPAIPLAFHRNQGDGTFEDRAQAAGLSDQLGGLNCVQADYNNDGWLDLFVIRGAWLEKPMRPSLLKNNGDGTFSDVTEDAGLMEPTNAILARWSDYDNDGDLDLFVGCELTRHRLYRNDGQGHFKDVAKQAGVDCLGYCRGASWGDIDRDGQADLLITYLDNPPRLMRNKGDGAFEDVASQWNVREPNVGFSCWFWDYDNDGWQDIFATGYRHTLIQMVKSSLKMPQSGETSRLYRNRQGKTFEDVSKEAGVAVACNPMGTNFADFDNDGFLDFYLGTGDPNYSSLVPNRMFRNLGGERFADITFSSRTGHLQKGHGVACGDWDRDGNVDLFVQMGGATPGDVFQDVLFQNPGNHGHRWLSVKLVGVKTNRSAIGARIKVVTSGGQPQTVYRHVDSGSSFGANALEQLIGLGQADGIASLEIHWPTSGTTQVFHDVPVDRALEVTEFAETYRTLQHEQIPLPQ